MLHLELMVGGLRVEAAHRLASVQVILYTLTTNYVFCVCIYSDYVIYKVFAFCQTFMTFIYALIFIY